MNLPEIALALKDMKIKPIADATGLHVNTIAKIRDGISTDPSYLTVERLKRYFMNRKYEVYEAEKKKILEENLTPDQYQKRMKELTEKLGV